MFNVQCTMFNVHYNVTMYLLYCCYLWDHKNKPQAATKVSEDTPQAYRSVRADGVKERGFQKGEN